ncbi:thioredoxin family protein [Streptomyces leeuwenhoekii]|uniref:Thioredoxin n=1 Tax=Streptomyces leeuwenhoekii TaxID=1437453 RepID=A0A0F7VL53_STRLW|nr:thioredoxin domain-containing protein [Streptomyces leeuwenhoekii]KMS68491.1 thioredoxin [Streptomyces leeuwenhoekii]CQR59320.1 Thioredoxin [Streptomyces leeuwenhoekii]
MIRHVTDDSFADEVLRANRGVLVHFYADWSDPSTAMARILDEVAAEYEGRLGVVRVDVDANPETPSMYHVRSVPTLLLFKNGALAGKKVGACVKSQITAFIDSHS